MTAANLQLFFSSSIFFFVAVHVLGIYSYFFYPEHLCLFGCYPHFPNELFREKRCAVTNEETRNAVLGTCSYKAPGKDGL